MPGGRVQEATLLSPLSGEITFRNPEEDFEWLEGCSLWPIFSTWLEPLPWHREGGVIGPAAGKRAQKVGM